MASLPKLLPSWHDLSLQDIVRQKGYTSYVQLHPPDFGGIGVDVNIGAKSPCTISKFYNSQLRFSSSKCSLPFFPLKSSKPPSLFFPNSISLNYSIILINNPYFLTSKTNR